MNIFYSQTQILVETSSATSTESQLPDKLMWISVSLLQTEELMGIQVGSDINWDLICHSSFNCFSIPFTALFLVVRSLVDYISILGHGLQRVTRQGKVMKLSELQKNN